MNSHANLRLAVLLLAVSACFSRQAYAATSSSPPLYLGAGQTELVRGLLYVGPAAKRDYLVLLKSYEIQAIPPGQLIYTVVVKDLAGAVQTFPLQEGAYIEISKVVLVRSIDLRVQRKDPLSQERIRFHLKWTELILDKNSEAPSPVP